LELVVQAPRPADGLSDLDRLRRSLSRALDGRVPEVPLRVLRALPEALRAADGRVTLSLAGDDASLRVVDCIGGRAQVPALGIAVDLGTTTIAVQLIDLESGKVLATRNGYNAQIACGLDVISRINYAARPERLEDLRIRAVDSINRLFLEAAADAGVAPSDAVCGRISGNTVMMHLLLGVKPEYIRLDPYVPAVLSVAHLTAKELGLALNPDAMISFSPCVGSYVGGDITAGLLITDLVRDREDIALFLDVGTNGEIVAGNRDFLMACACSAGPAFEGGGIENGMRATVGAIDHVTIDRASGRATYTVIGGGLPAGICGSGLIDLLSGLFLSGWLDPAGRFERSRKSAHIRIDGRRASYILAAEGQTLSGTAILISENDIENLMRAKAAIYAAAALMLEQAGLGFDSLGAFYVAGGFGRRLNLDNAISIGLLPDIDPERFFYLGNASLEGTRLALLSREHRDLQKAAAERMTYLDLSALPGYMDHYTAALFLPHTDLGRFPRQRTRLRGGV
ncbi:MAG TPA: ASKHA domain-containing protein, partial [Deltaproteobacteria bacterium]|nr:ASKHA domain-containing protein [Deltaproteobacteria bacterium]